MSGRATEPIVIVGAGIGGLGVAAALRNREHRVVVLEERAGLDTIGAGISLWPNALRALDEIGIGGRIRSAGGPVATGGIRRHDGRWLRTMDQAKLQVALGEPLIAIHRATLLDLLYAAVAPDAVRWASPVRKVETTAHGVVLTLADGSAMPAAAVIGADGIGSVVAQGLDAGLRFRYAGYTAWRGVAKRGLDGAEPTETWGPGGEFGFLPLGPDTTYWFATERTVEGERAPEGELAHLIRRYAGWHEPIGSLLAATEPEAVLRHDVVDRSSPRRWSAGPITLIGDAAHPMRPHLGQGGCQALVDAAVLARLIDRADSLPAAFREYESVQRRRAVRAVRESSWIGRAIHCPPALNPAVQRLVSIPPTALIAPHLAAIGGSRAFPAP